jgi:hypothetical protein
MISDTAVVAESSTGRLRVARDVPAGGFDEQFYGYLVAALKQRRLSIHAPSNSIQLAPATSSRRISPQFPLETRPQ